MRIEVTQVLKFYWPVKTDPRAMRSIMQTQGGFTTYHAWGHWWDGEGKMVGEAVAVDECCGKFEQPAIVNALWQYLVENPGEQAALAKWYGPNGIVKFYMDRSDLERKF